MTRRLDLVIRWQNDMVTTFDAEGAQVTDLQGPYTPELKQRLLAAADAATQFRHGIWRPASEKTVTREEW